MRRKTVDVGWVREKVNAYLSSPTTGQIGRQAVASLLELILLETENYRGFCYVDVDGKSVVYQAGETDETRRSYFAPRG